MAELDFLSQLDQNEWLEQFFDAQQVDKGGIIRRSIKDVERLASKEKLLFEVKQRGFHMVETGEQYVIFCHTGAMKIHC
ncbi:MAG: N-(5'-phosphoribosyl)anthranilate isomerase [Planctomycetes bacterium]|nr:N-(5'-phosphoribosyl)anthranilate isomerase [Planctomycetota bacterium]